jgi:hypothetical protein
MSDNRRCSRHVPGRVWLKGAGRGTPDTIRPAQNRQQPSNRKKYDGGRRRRLCSAFRRDCSPDYERRNKTSVNPLAPPRRYCRRNANTGKESKHTNPRQTAAVDKHNQAHEKRGNGPVVEPAAERVVVSMEGHAPEAHDHGRGTDESGRIIPCPNDDQSPGHDERQ